MKSWFKRFSHSEQSTSSTALSQESKPKVFGGNVDPQLRDNIEFAFTSGGIDYFCYREEIGMPYSRFMAAMDIYQELEYGLSPAFILQACDSFQAICLDPKNKTVEHMKQKIGILAHSIRERVEVSISLTTHIKLATVRYFDETEDPTSFNHGKAAEKIAHWSKHHDVPEFFFMQPISRFMPPLDDLKENLPKYLQGEAVQLLSLMEVALRFDLQENDESELRNVLKTQEEMLQTIRNWPSSRSGNIA